MLHTNQRPLSYVEQVVIALEDEIIGGKLQPGQRLRENDLAQRLGVSRSPVREALRHLEHEGLVQILPQRGVYVRPLTAEDALNLYAVRASVVPVIARLGTERCSDAEIRELEEIVSDMETAARARDRRGFVDLHFVFVGVLVRATANDWLQKMLWGISKASLRYGSFALGVPGHFEASLKGHRRVLQAIRRCDAETAESALRTLLEESGRRVARYLKRQPAAEAAASQSSAGRGDDEPDRKAR